MGIPVKNILLLSLATVTLLNCGGSGAKKKTTELTGTQPLEEAVLPADQRTIATRICYAYQSKATTFRTTPFMGGTFKFDMRHTNCSNQLNQYSLTPVLRYNLNNALEFFQPDTSKLFAGTVQTDTSGFLSQLCTKIKNNEAINNTTVNNDVRVQVEFFREDLDAYTLRYFVLDGGDYKFESADTFKVRTQFNLSGSQILGMDETFTRQKVCPGLPIGSAPAFSQFIQQFDKRL